MLAVGHPCGFGINGEVARQAGEFFALDLKQINLRIAIFRQYQRELAIVW